jgi:hypothetical protein
LAALAAAQPQWHFAQHQLLSQIRDVQPCPGQNVGLAERVIVATGIRVKPLVDVGVHRHIDLF